MRAPYARRLFFEVEISPASDDIGPEEIHDMVLDVVMNQEHTTESYFFQLKRYDCRSPACNEFFDSPNHIKLCITIWRAWNLRDTSFFLMPPGGFISHYGIMI